MQEPGKKKFGDVGRLEYSVRFGTPAAQPVEPLPDVRTTRPERAARAARWKTLTKALSVILLMQHVAPSSAALTPVAAEGKAGMEPGVNGGSIPLYPAYPDFRLFPDPPHTTDTPEARNGQDRGQARHVVQGIPATVLQAYQRAVDTTKTAQPGCRLPLSLLAAIGKVESGHARGGNVDAQGTTRAPILGPQLNGSPGVAAIADTDHGVYDGDTVWDRAVGPMQFIPSTWRRWAADGNADGVSDPNNVFDASLAAGRYLCAAGGDLTTSEGLRRGILAYNHSEFYLSLVRAWMRVYSGGPFAVPDTPGPDSDTTSGPPRRNTRQPAPEPPPHREDKAPEPRRSPRNQPTPTPSSEPSSPTDEGGTPGGTAPSPPNAPTVPVPVPTPSASSSTAPTVNPQAAADELGGRPDTT